MLTVLYLVFSFKWPTLKVLPNPFLESGLTLINRYRVFLCKDVLDLFVQFPYGFRLFSNVWTLQAMLQWASLDIGHMEHAGWWVEGYILRSGTADQGCGYFKFSSVAGLLLCKVAPTYNPTSTIRRQ